MAKEKREEFARVYSEYFPLVLNSLYTKVGNIDDAHDVCQDIFTIYYQKMDEVENSRKWLFGAMRNVVFEYYRKKKKAPVDLEQAFSDIALTFVNGFRDTRIIISDAIERVEMSEEERLIFEYIAVNNYSYANVGNIMGLTKAQVRYAYQGIVKKIVYHLEQKGIGSIEELL